MIQRIQTVYLSLVTAILVASMCLPMGVFTKLNLVSGYTFKPLGFEVEGTFYSTWGVFGILLLSAIVALATIFLYKNRMLQIRMSIFNSVLILGYYAAFLTFMFVLEKNLGARFEVHWALFLPLVAIVLNVFAIRAIGRDEVMVKAADRLR